MTIFRSLGTRSLFVLIAIVGSPKVAFSSAPGALQKVLVYEGKGLDALLDTASANTPLFQTNCFAWLAYLEARLEHQLADGHTLPPIPNIAPVNVSEGYDVPLFNGMMSLNTLSPPELADDEKLAALLAKGNVAGILGAALVLRSPGGRRLAVRLAGLAEKSLPKPEGSATARDAWTLAHGLLGDYAHGVLHEPAGASKEQIFEYYRDLGRMGSSLPYVLRLAELGPPATEYFMQRLEGAIRAGDPREIKEHISTPLDLLDLVGDPRHASLEPIIARWGTASQAETWSSHRRRPSWYRQQSLEAERRVLLVDWTWSTEACLQPAFEGPE